jgi:REP element-mobilizing transposase RayT
MARRPRIKVPGHAAAYHVVTRTNGQEYRLDNRMKEIFITILKSLSTLYYTRYISWSVMDNHTHLLLCLKDTEDINPKDAIQRWNRYHSKEYRLNAAVESYRNYAVKELTDISSYMKRLNLLLTNAYNRHTGKTGTLWEGRYHSTIIERGYAVLQCSAYIELNSFRAGKVKQPENYKYSSLNYLIKGNRDKLIDIDLLEEGLDISLKYKHISKPKLYQRELTKAYTAYIYEAGTKPAKDKQGRIKEKGLVITEAMKQKLKKYGLKSEKGIFLTKVWEYTKGKFLGGAEFADRFYEDYINPGYSGKEKRSHMEQWIHASSTNLWSIFSVLDKRLTRGSP